MSADARDAVSQLGDLAGEDVDLGLLVQIPEALDDQDAVRRQDRGGLVSPGLQEVGRTDDERPPHRREPGGVEAQPAKLR